MKALDKTTLLTSPAIVLALAMMSPAAAQSMPDGTQVRILATSLGGGSLDGTPQMNKSSGSTRVVLDEKHPAVTRWAL